MFEPGDDARAADTAGGPPDFSSRRWADGPIAPTWTELGYYAQRPVYDHTGRLIRLRCKCMLDREMPAVLPPDYWQCPAGCTTENRCPDCGFAWSVNVPPQDRPPCPGCIRDPVARDRAYRRACELGMVVKVRGQPFQHYPWKDGYWQ